MENTYGFLSQAVFDLFYVYSRLVCYIFAILYIIKKATGAAVCLPPHIY